MDVKPGNIFLDEDLNARLGDPGMAQELPIEYSYASISQLRGTDGYMDEYLEGRHLKPVNDVFSFGVGGYHSVINIVKCVGQVVLYLESKSLLIIITRCCLGLQYRI